MSDRNEIVKALMANSPSNGGLNALNRPAPYGLRAYPDGNGGYGGQMMPKFDGWQGALPNTAYPGSVSTELSVEDELGDFPSIVPNTSPEQLKRLLNLKHEQQMPQDIYETARKFANERRALGLNPFLDAEIPK